MKLLRIAVCISGLLIMGCTKPVVPTSTPAADAPSAAAPSTGTAPSPVVVGAPSAPVAKAVVRSPGPHATKPFAKPRSKPAAQDGEAAAYAKAYANAARANKLLGEKRYREAPVNSGLKTSVIPSWMVEAHYDAPSFYHTAAGPVLDQYVMVVTIMETGDSGFIAELGAKTPIIFKTLGACRDKLTALAEKAKNQPKMPGFILGCYSVGDTPIYEGRPTT